MPKRAPADPDKFEEASKWFRGRVVVTRAEWDAMSRQARRQAFTIAGTQQAKVVQAVFDAIALAIDKGTPIDKWRKELRKKLGAFADKNSATLTTAFINANQTAYNTGRYYQMSNPAVTVALPYRVYDSVLDSRTCFAAGTLVRMANGSTKPIESVEPGDEVLSCRGVQRTVRATLVTPKRTWGNLTLSNGQKLRVTPSHPILTTGGWIPAIKLQEGDALVVEGSDLRDLWSVAASGRSQKILRTSVQNRAAVRNQTLQNLQETVSTNWSTVDVLQRRLFVGRSEIYQMPRMRGVVSEDDQHGAVLQQQVSRGSEKLRAVRRDVCLSPHLRQTRPVSLLFGRLPAAFAGVWNAARDSHEAVCQMRSSVQSVSKGSDKGRKQNVVFESVPTSATAKMRTLRENRETSQTTALLSELLPETLRRDGFGSVHTKVARSARDSVRARGQDWSLVSGLSGCQQDCFGGGRSVLAQSRKDARARPASRPAVDRKRVLGGSDCRERVQEGPGLRDPRALDLWPVPGDQVAHAASAIVVGVDWELTLDAEPAYDIQVDEDAGFIANGVVVHNSDICKGLNGTVLLHSDPWWLTHWPPMHHRCRSSVRALSASMAKKRGLTTKLPRPEIPDDFGLAPPLRAGQVWEPSAADFDPAAWAIYQRNQSRMKAANDNATAPKRKPRKD